MLSALVLFLVLFVVFVATQRTVNGLTAWSTFAAVVLALVSSAFSIWQLHRQLRTQNELAQKKIEEEYLARALYVALDCYKAALVYRSAIAEIEHSRGGDSSVDSEDKKAARRDLYSAWKRFDSDMKACITVIGASQGESCLVSALNRAYKASESLYSKLMDSKASLEAEKELAESLPELATAKCEADAAREELAARLRELYRS